MLSIRTKRRGRSHSRTSIAASKPGWAYVESLETRQLLTATANSSFGVNPTTFAIDIPAQVGDNFIHDFSLSITNDAGLSTPTINSTQLNSGGATVHVDLSGTIIGPIGTTTLAHVAVLQVYVNGTVVNNSPGTPPVTTFTDNGFNAVTMRDTISYTTSVNLPSGESINNTLGLVFRNNSTGQATPLMSFFSNVAVDTTSPMVSSVGPIAANLTAPIDTTNVTFSKGIVTASFTTSDVSLTRGGVPVVLSGLTIAPVLGSTTNYTISGLAPFTSTSGNYVLSVSPTGITDPAGNPGAGSPATASFTQTIAGPLATIIQPTTPTNTPVSNVNVTFSKPINPTTFTVSTLTLTHNGIAVPITGIATIAPIGASTTNYTIGGLGTLTTAQGTYVLTVNDAAIQDTNGNLGTGTPSTTFVIDTTPPAIASTNVPSTTTAPLNVVTVTLSKPILVSSFSPSAITLTFGGNAVPPLSGLTITPFPIQNPPLPMNPTSTQFLINGLAPFTGKSGSYVLSINPAGFQDAAGNISTAAPTTVAFNATVAGPSITLVGPITTPRNTAVSSVPVTFSGATEAATFTAADVALTLNGVAVPLSGLTFTPNTGSATAITVGGLAPFTAAQGNYVLTVSPTGVTDPFGNPATGSPVVTNFTVDTTAPTLVSVGPEPATITSSINTADVAFSKPIVAASFLPSNVSLTHNGTAVALSGITITPVSGSLSNYTISGLANFTATPGTYVLTVSPMGVFDLAGNAATGNSVSTSFDFIAPSQVVGLTIDGSTSRNTPLTFATVTLTAPINPATFTSQALSLSLNGVNVPLNSTVQVTQLTSTTYQINGLAPFTTTPGSYVLTVNGATLVSTNGLPVTGSASTAFVVKSTVATTTGAVVTLIQRSRNDVHPYVLITFNRPMTESAAIRLLNYTLLPATQKGAGRGVHPISATYDAVNNIVVLRFGVALRKNGFYLIKINGTVPTGLTDTLTGNPLEGQTKSPSGGAIYSSYFGGPNGYVTTGLVTNPTPTITAKAKTIAGPARLRRHYVV
jgi:hypothetical protein